MGVCAAKESASPASGPAPSLTPAALSPRELVLAARKLPEDVDREKGLRTVHDPALIAKPKANFRKVLLLGAGESGKSTFFKQMVNIFGEGYNIDDRRAFIQAVHSNLIEGMQVLLANSRRFARENSDLYEIAPDLHSDVELILRADDQAPLTGELSNAIKVLWTDPGVRQTYRRRNRFQCPDSAHYFFKRLSETDLVDEDYIPTEEDVLRARVRSTGIKQTRILLNEQKVELVDVGGQKNERKKWMHCFENVDTLLFLVAISEYDQVMWEDHTKNRMHDALDLFAQIVNSRWFSKTNVCLVFNKTDTFAAKVKEHADDGHDRFPIIEAFPDFGEHNSVGRGLEFFKRKFLKMNRTGPRVHVFTTTATEKDSIYDFFAHLGKIIADTPPLWKRASASAAGGGPGAGAGGSGSGSVGRSSPGIGGHGGHGAVPGGGHRRGGNGGSRGGHSSGFHSRGGSNGGGAGIGGRHPSHSEHPATGSGGSSGSGGPRSARSSPRHVDGGGHHSGKHHPRGSGGPSAHHHAPSASRDYSRGSHGRSAGGGGYHSNGGSRGSSRQHSRDFDPDL